MSRSKPKTPGLLLVSVGTMLSSTVIAGFLLGYWLDGWLGTVPIFMLICGAMGLVGGIMKVCKLLNDPKLQ